MDPDDACYSAVSFSPKKLNSSTSMLSNDTPLAGTPDMSEPPQTVPSPADRLESRRFVRIPDLFSSIMARKPVVNPNYFQVKAEGDSWIAQIMRWDEETRTKYVQVDFCYISSIWVTTCDDEALRLTLDWQYWVFLFDDQFDEGHLRDDPVAAQEEVNATMAIMTDDQPLIQPDQNPIRHIFQTCWRRIKKRASPELQQRYREQYKRYFDQLVVQVERVAHGEALTINAQTYIEMRSGTIGLYPALIVCQFAENIKIPGSVFSHSSIQECMRLSAELCVLVNDVVSYRKELVRDVYRELGVDYNLISILGDKGLSVQQSMDELGVMVNNCYRRWYTALAELPSFGEEIDREVLKFVDICALVPLGNLHWSFMTARYFGAEGHEVSKTRILYLPD
ncbi:Presilphiperfolan-8-beta-ol synthase [Xylaria bambusicola]|uniref:Presilphiperfolan-8-beta-ol synthase n=1 Tax=Xylaria bambusicola TaxID=326684 RepID=UPI00200750F0|nr:Presilphiperfolan-8-beta-ol synthase [Xylaria bambusicola]KAI0516858.1 Presilphiperfolan-8-beta-ol synthase [Xylaria bambusicola]